MTQSPPNAPHAAHAAGVHADPAADKLGMWLFLFSELLLFGTLFIVYAVYLAMHRWQFHDASAELNRPIGAANTVILLTSSLTMALSIAAMGRGRRGASALLMSCTVLLAAAFLTIKGFEWSAKFHHGLYPGSAHLAGLARGQQVFFGLYYTMTGLHALHVIAGAGLILWVLVRLARGRVRPNRMVALDNVGLYWHLVDVIWIFLFPLFYLIS